MADIKQAAAWIKQGQSVRRPSWSKKVALRMTRQGEFHGPRDPAPGWLIFTCEGKRYASNVFTIDDLVANDWNVAP